MNQLKRFQKAIPEKIETLLRSREAEKILGRTRFFCLPRGKELTLARGYILSIEQNGRPPEKSTKTAVKGGRENPHIGTIFTAVWKVWGD